MTDPPANWGKPRSAIGKDCRWLPVHANASGNRHESARQARQRGPFAGDGRSDRVSMADPRLLVRQQRLLRHRLDSVDHRQQRVAAGTNLLEWRGALDAKWPTGDSAERREMR